MNKRKEHGTTVITKKFNVLHDCAVNFDIVIQPPTMTP
jgi:hypothetical protein